MAKTKKAEKEKIFKLAEELELVKLRYRFIQACNYLPLGDRRYEVDEEDELADWRVEHIKSALAAGIIERR